MRTSFPFKLDTHTRRPGVCFVASSIVLVVFVDQACTILTSVDTFNIDYSRMICLRAFGVPVIDAES